MLRDFKGACLDDGTGRNVYYVDENGEKSRKEPEGYVYETFENGHRRYYSRGLCIRCKNPTPQILLTKNVGNEAYCLNLCADCIIKTTPNIKRMRGSGDILWESNIDTPKCMYRDLMRPALSINKDIDLIKRAREAGFRVKSESKTRRNSDRSDEVKFKSGEYGVFAGKMMSWGFGTVFDEYYGLIDPDSKLPHGLGVRYYNDGSIYYGQWANGKKEGHGLWIRPDGSQYEGPWVKGLKHGIGAQTYPDASKFVGEFAKGYEHGQGTRTYQDKTVFEGRHRFGKRDGMGTLTTPDGQVVKKVWKEADVFHEKAVPEVVEGMPEDTDGTRNYFEPPSLMTLSVRALARAMHKKRHLVPTARMRDRLADYMKPLVAREFLETANPMGNRAFIEFIADLAYRSPSSLVCSDIKFVNKDFDALMYFVSCNSALSSLSLTFNKMDGVSMDMLNRRLQERAWPALTHLNLSFNKIDFTALQNLVVALDFNPAVSVLRLSGCKINANGAAILSQFLIDNTVIREVDLSFNAILVAGAEAMAEAIMHNKSLTSLSLRSNNIGSLGGQVVVNAVRHSACLRELCIIDNKIGVEIMTQLSGLLQGNIMDVARSVKYKELTLPAAHKEIDQDRHARRRKKTFINESQSDIIVPSDILNLEDSGKAEEDEEPLDGLEPFGEGGLGLEPETTEADPLEESETLQEYL